MRFWWPDWHSERSPSSDSECSTDDHSSLASDGSFYDASSDAETGVDFDQSPPSILDDTQLVIGDRTAANQIRLFPERSAVPIPLEVGPYGMGRDDMGQAHRATIGAPIFDRNDGENGPRTPPRATLPRGGDAELDAATSGTCSEHASPLALQLPARSDVSGARAAARSPVPTLGTVEDRGEARRHPVGTGEGTFGPILGLSIGVAVASHNAQQHATTATAQDGAACVGPSGPQAHRPPPPPRAVRLPPPRRTLPPLPQPRRTPRRLLAYPAGRALRCPTGYRHYKDKDCRATAPRRKHAAPGYQDVQQGHGHVAERPPRRGSGPRHCV